MNYKNKFYKTVIFFITFIFFSSTASASTLYLETSEGGYGQGDSFIVDIKIDNVTECVNTIEAEILFPDDYLNVLEFLTGESILSLWVDKPSSADLTKVNSEGKFHFSGGIPGGYCGKIPGDPGDSNLVGKIIFKIPGFIVSDNEREDIDISFGDKTRILLNDGLGTEDILEKKNTNFKILKGTIVSDNNWKDLIADDVIQPEPFVVELHQRSDIFNGLYYIIFSTVDKQSGVDHYEVLEIKPNEVIGIEPSRSLMDRLFGKKKNAPNWKVAEMPYLLEDQSLESIIKVRALDKAGNSRQVEFIPPKSNTTEKEMSSRSILIVVLSIIIVVVFILLLILFIKKRKNIIKE